MLSVPRLVRTSSALYRTLSFIFTFKSPRHRSQSWAWQIQSTPSHRKPSAFPLMRSVQSQVFESFSFLQHFQPKLYVQYRVLREMITIEAKVSHSQNWPWDNSVHVPIHHLSSSSTRFSHACFYFPNDCFHWVLGRKAVFLFLLIGIRIAQYLIIILTPNKQA